MLTSDLIHETYAAVTVNKGRSALTILGIVIGIASVVALTAIGRGTQNSIQSRIQSIGSNLVLVTPGAQRSRTGAAVSAGRGSAATLTILDSDAIATASSDIKAVAPEVTKRYQVTAKGTNTNTSIVGTVPSYTEVRSVAIDEGSFITASQVTGLDKVAVLGPTTRDDLFGVGATGVVGQTIRINKINFKVIGITVAKGGSGFGSQDDTIYIPITTAQHFLAGNDNVSTISVEVVDAKSMSAVQQDVTNLLLQRHNISDPTQADFSVMNQADIVAAASSVTGTFTLLLAAIAGISLLVGGIGIMNMMLTNVTERTREIGLRKAIGARRRDISRQFLVESVMLTFAGGILGVALGWALAAIVAALMSIPAQVTLTSVALAFGVSAGIGVLFGWYPARRASGLNPIEALRYE
jgi:putative ABC transport system permease protein